ncbi:MAG: hypothetical protein IKN72_08520 [Clostridia bacterium]|nr:hypothetical protein [Clostridia bacterium]
MGEYKPTEEILQRNVPHGALRGCAYVSLRYHGDPHFYRPLPPGMHSAEGIKITAERTDAGVTVTETEEQRFGDPVIKIYKAGPDALAALEAFTEKEHFAALSTMEVLCPPTGANARRVILLDYDSPVPGRPPLETKAVQILALEEHGLQPLAEEFRRLLTDVTKNAVLVSQQGTRVQQQGFMGAIGTSQGTTAFQPQPPKPTAPLPEGGWACPMCGNVNTGGFCPECGAARPKS